MRDGVDGGIESRGRWGLGIHDDQAWEVEKRFRVTEVFLAIMWVCVCNGIGGKSKKRGSGD